MSHEIYYTSAPEGLKRHSSGFCTVAASENIPKALWDRLETLSAYRHQFAAGQEQNPVCHAHWILSVTGRTYHVLSRVCDSGMDHTQRTNAFAHHLVLESAEIQAAPGGPAWMLDQRAVMVESWDGRVGALPHDAGRLPRGDIVSRSPVCRAWEALTGDAGWGGHLADVFVRTPSKPVCIIFAPGQNMLSLMAEAIALLPPTARWNVTFNTYFTSMPTSATCAWRCCLAGTPAAQVGLRYAATGLVLDLTDRSRLPALPAGPYVAMARTGVAPASARPVAAAAKVPTSPAAARQAPKAPAQPPVDLEMEAEEREEETRRDRIFELADEVESKGADNRDVSTHEEAPAPLYRVQDETPVPPAQAERPRSQALSPRPIRRSDEMLRQADLNADRAAQTRRRQIMLLFGAALAALGIGSGLIYLAQRQMAPSEGPPATANPLPAPRVENVQPAPLPQPPGDSHPTPAPTPTAPPVIAVASQPTITSQTPSAAYPDVIILANLLEKPGVGMGMGDRVQSISLRAADIDAPAGITAMRLQLPQARPSAQSPAAGTPTYKNADLGTLAVRSEMRGGKPGVALLWKASSDLTSTGGSEAAFISLDRTRPSLELEWHAPMLLRNPASLSLLYWALQNSRIELVGARAIGQRIQFKAFSPGPLNFADQVLDVAWPADLPGQTVVIAPVLPPPAPGTTGWQASWYTDWEVKDAALRSAENASQVLKFTKQTNAAAVNAWFLLTFRPGLGKIESTFARRLESDQADLARYESDLRAIDSQIDDAKARNAGVTDTPVPQDLRVKREQTVALINAYKEAVAGYKELTAFDVAFELPDGVHLATLHFQRQEKTEAGK